MACGIQWYDLALCSTHLKWKTPDVFSHLKWQETKYSPNNVLQIYI